MKSQPLRWHGFRAGVLMAVLASAACAPVLAEKSRKGKPDSHEAPVLASDWARPMVLPPPGRAVARVGGNVYHLDEINVCEVRENGQSFLFRGTGTDHEGRLLIARIYRRLAGDRTMAPAEDELLEVSVRDGESRWSSSIMRLQRQEAGGDIRVVHGQAEDMPAVQVRGDGRGAWASGWIRPKHGYGDLVGSGPAYVAVQCRGAG